MSAARLTDNKCILVWRPKHKISDDTTDWSGETAILHIGSSNEMVLGPVTVFGMQTVQYTDVCALTESLALVVYHNSVTLKVSAKILKIDGFAISDSNETVLAETPGVFCNISKFDANTFLATYTNDIAGNYGVAQILTLGNS